MTCRAKLHALRWHARAWLGLSRAWTWFRGHRIELRRGAWRYVDNGEAVEHGWRERPCGLCDRRGTPEGHDACLGTLPGVANASCGHGRGAEAYIQYPDGTTLRGISALRAFAKLGVGPERDGDGYLAALRCVARRESVLGRRRR